MLSLPTPAELRAARLHLGLTQAALAKAAGVSQPLVARIELGTVDPRYSSFKAIIDALNAASRTVVPLTSIMTRPIATVRPSDPVTKAIRSMRTRGISQLPVLDHGVPVGCVTESDLVHAMADSTEAELASMTVRDIMSPPLPAVGPGRSVDDVKRVLEREAAVVVMEGGKVLGIVTRNNLLGTVR